MSYSYATISSAPPKKRAGRTKFRETRHPLYRGIRTRGTNGARWVCEVREPNKKSRIWLGTFPTAEMAARAHDVAAMALRGHKACLNFADSAWRLTVPQTSSHDDIRKAAVAAAEMFRPQSSSLSESYVAAEEQSSVSSAAASTSESSETSMAAADAAETSFSSLFELIEFDVANEEQSSVTLAAASTSQSSVTSMAAANAAETSFSSLFDLIEFDTDFHHFGLPLEAVTGSWGQQYQYQYEWDAANYESVADVSLWSHSI